MGVSNTKTKCLKSNELLEFSKVSTFTSEEINDLYLFFNHLSKAKRDDGVIDYEEFCQAVGIRDGIYARNLFKIFDTNDDKVINFREFILGFATFLNETIDKQIRLSFKLYDPEDKGRVRKETVVAIMADALKSGGLGTLQFLPDELIEELVDDTFQEARQKYFAAGVQVEGGQGPTPSQMAHTGANLEANSALASHHEGAVLMDDDEDVITFDMYEKMVYENNDIIKWLAIDLQRVCQASKLIQSDKASIKNITSPS